MDAYYKVLPHTIYRSCFSQVGEGSCGVNFFPKGGGNVLLFVVHTSCCSRDLFMFENLYCNDQLYQRIKGYFPSQDINQSLLFRSSQLYHVFIVMHCINYCFFTYCLY